MVKKINLIVATLYSISLVLFETIMNLYWKDWGFYPLWLIDYLIAIILIFAVFFFKKNNQNLMLLIGWSLSIGTTYMALFVSLDPNGLNSADIESKLPFFVLAILISIFGFVLTIFDIKNLKKNN